MTASGPGLAPIAPEYLQSIQALRAVAAILVALAHVQYMVHVYAGFGLIGNSWLNATPLSVQAGAFGVDLFFVISGVIMVHITRGQIGQAGYAADFLARRFLRVVPLYWFYTSALVVALWVKPDVVRPDYYPTAWHIIAAYLFIPDYNGRGQVVPVLYVGWTLFYEMMFYGLFAMLMRRPRTWIVPGLLLAFGALMLARPALSHAGAIGFALSSSIVFEFVFGCAIGLALLDRRMPKAVGWALLVLGAATSAVAVLVVGDPPDWRWLIWGLPAALIVAGAVCIEKNSPGQRWGALGALGASSYTLYLTHPLTAPLIGRSWAKLEGLRALPVELLILVTLVLVVGAAHLAHLVIEKPLLAWLHRRYRTLWRKRRGTGGSAPFPG